MAKFQAPFFNAQFIDDTGVPISSGLLYTYASGTVTNQTTWQDQAGTSTNANPIVLDSAGRCNLWLGTSEYTFTLKRADTSLVKTFDHVAASGVASLVVSSVNGSTGVVVLAAPNIAYSTSTSTTWFVGTDVAAALDVIITYVNTSVANIGFANNVPQNSKSIAYTTLLADQGKHLLHPSADVTARTFTIDSNTNVAYPIGTVIEFVNQNAAGVLTIAITTDTMRLAGAGTTGSRTLAANGVARALKITTTEWIISGTGLT